MLQMGGIVGPENLEGSNRKRDLSAKGPHSLSRASADSLSLTQLQQHTLSLSLFLSLSHSHSLSLTHIHTHTHTHTHFFLSRLLFPALSDTLSPCLGLSQSLILQRFFPCFISPPWSAERGDSDPWLAGWLAGWLDRLV